MIGLSWEWIAVMGTAPGIVGLLVALPLWRWRQTILGNILGTLVIFGTAVGLIMREHVVLDRATQACLDAGFTCWPEPSAFTRYAVYAFMGLFEVFALFLVSLSVERRLRDREYSAEWR